MIEHVTFESSTLLLKCLAGTYEDKFRASAWDMDAASAMVSWYVVAARELTKNNARMARMRARGGGVFVIKFNRAMVKHGGDPMDCVVCSYSTVAGVDSSSGDSSAAAAEEETFPVRIFVEFLLRCSAFFTNYLTKITT
jgi:hypothetical protein